MNILYNTEEDFGIIYQLNIDLDILYSEVKSKRRQDIRKWNNILYQTDAYVLRLEDLNKRFEDFDKRYTESKKNYTKINQAKVLFKTEYEEVLQMLQDAYSIKNLVKDNKIALSVVSVGGLTVIGSSLSVFLLSVILIIFFIVSRHNKNKKRNKYE
jgi:hypothetical protein